MGLLEAGVGVGGGLAYPQGRTSKRRLGATDPTSLGKSSSACGVGMAFPEPWTQQAQGYCENVPLLGLRHPWKPRVSRKLKGGQPTVVAILRSTVQVSTTIQVCHTWACCLG
jgi:hypothetical protein